MSNKLDYSKISDIVLEGIDTSDYPDFCDAYIASATYDGEEMTNEQIEMINQDTQYVYDCVIDHLF